MMSLHYGILQSLYWMLFAVINGFVTVFFLARGLNESLIGVLIAGSNILAALLQPVVAGWIDRSIRWRLKDIGLMIVAATIGILALGLVFPVISVVTFLLAIIMIWTLQPIVNSIAIYYLNRGEKLNFGVTRAAGSAAFALVSVIIGYLVKRFGVDVLVWSGLLFSLATALCLWLFRMDYASQSGTDPYKHVRGSRNFIQNHRSFVIFLIGIVLLFTFHTFATTYLIRVVERIGGDEATMGTAVAIAAIAEIPFFIFSDRLIRRFGVKKILIFASVFWVVKAVGLWLSPSVKILYLVLLTQAVSYAPLIPGSIYYTNSRMKDGEKVLGQALLTAAFTVGGVVGSLLGGIILSNFGVLNLLIAGLVITIAGGLIITGALMSQEN